MPVRRSWDDRWKTYPASVPQPVVDGIATSRQRGDMATSWWSGRLVALLDSFGLGARMQRGRRYARRGQLLSFEVHPNLVVAQVQGSRRTPYVVTVATTPLADSQWDEVEVAMRARVAFAAELLAGHVPPELEAVFDDAGVALLPRQWQDVRANCSCPDWENPCKHIAAVLYVFADRLDDDPWLLLRWRGREREDVLAHLRADAGPRAEVAPWWPLQPGVPLPVGEGHGSREAWADADPATRATAALLRLGPLAVDVRAHPVTDILTNIYTAVVETASSPAIEH